MRIACLWFLCQVILGMAFADEGLLKADASEEVWKRALQEQKPEALFESLRQVKEADERHFLISTFFYHLAAQDWKKAVKLLPDQLSSREQNHWAMPVLNRIARAGDLESVRVFLLARFDPKMQYAALGNVISLCGLETIAYEDVLSFWKALEGEPVRDAHASYFALPLVKKDAIRAIEWFESLDGEVREKALDESMVAAKPEMILRQLEKAQDQELRLLLGKFYGARHRREDSQVVQERISALPKDVLTEAEYGYAQALGPGAAGSQMDMKALKLFLKWVSSTRGRDAASEILIRDEFSKSPENGLSLIIQWGLSQRAPEVWERYVGWWLRKDAAAASKFILDLPDGEERRTALRLLEKQGRKR